MGQILSWVNCGKWGCFRNRARTRRIERQPEVVTREQIMTRKGDGLGDISPDFSRELLGVAPHAMMPQGESESSQAV